MDTKDKIKVMQAFIDGRPLQFGRSGGGGGWRDINFEPTWNWDRGRYRIKPEPPVELWCTMDGNGRSVNLYNSEKKARAKVHPSRRVCLMREVRDQCDV